MKYYIRTTHNFNNETREWKYRGDLGGDKFNEWNKIDSSLNIVRYKYSLGVHVLESGRWMNLREIVEDPIWALSNGATDDAEDFLIFMKSNPNYREIVEKDVTEELDYLISMDMVRVKDGI